MVKREQESNMSSDVDTRQFKLPCLMKLEDLMQKFSGQLEINWRSRINSVKSNGKGTLQDGDKQHKGQQDTDNVTIRRDSRGSSSRASNSGDSLNEIQFRAPRKVGFRRTPKHRKNSGEDEVDEPSDAIIINSDDIRPSSRQKRAEKNNHNATVTTNGNQNPPQRTPAGPKKTRSGKVRQPPPKAVDKQHVFGGFSIKPGDPLIDTKNFVDDAMIVFLPEMCHRAGIDLVKDPMQLCTRFSLVLPDVNLNLKEIECIDMTGD